jgi:hypothetical protein
MKLQYWKTTVRVGTRSVTRNLATMVEAKRFVTLLLNALVDRQELDAKERNYIAAEMFGLTGASAMAMGGWFLARATPPWQVTLLPYPAIGYTHDEVLLTQ